jgi:molybdopterin/thiamine biosynthesis adenylyltransferase
MPLETISELDHLFGKARFNYENMLHRYAENPSAAVNQLNTLKKKGEETYFGIVFLYQTGWFWQFFKLQRIQKHKKEMSVLPIATSAMETLSARISGILNVDRLSKKKVLIAGCGGIGGTIAVEMACAGVGTLFLNDADTISVANVIRHECSLVNLGDRKSDAVKFKIATKNPLTSVVADTEIFSDPEFENKVSQSDLVVCAIGDYNTDAYINQLCVKYRKPMVFAYIGVYGSMGHVVRLSVENGETGCFKCFRRHLRAEGIPDLPEIADINAVTVELGCNNPSLPAPSFDQRTVSLIAVRKAIQWLDPWSYADDTADAIVFYARHLEGVVEKQSLKTEKFSVPALEDCSVCGGAARQ